METARDATQDLHATVALDFTTNEKSGNMLVEGWIEKTGETDEEGKPVYNMRAEVLEASEAEIEGSLLVSNGETFWAYNPEENTVLTGNKADMPERPETDPAGATEAFQDMLERGLDAFEIEVVAEEEIAGQPTWKLELTPTTDTEEQLQLDGLIDITMWVSQDEEFALPLKMAVDGSDMGSGTLEVRSFELNSGLDDDLFTFDIPEGAEVVDAAELAEQMRPRTMTLDEAAAEVDFPLLSPTVLPGDAALVEVQVLGGETVIQNYVGSGVTFSVVQSSDDVGAEREPPIGSEVEQVTVRGQEAMLVTGNGAQQGSLLRWEEDGVRLVVAGTLSAEDALSVAESLE
jgi:outer membrane lipoprotein-sorting protein